MSSGSLTLGLLATGARTAVLWSEAHTKQRGEVGLCQLEAEVGVLHQTLLSTSQSRFPDLLCEHFHPPPHPAAQGILEYNFHCFRDSLSQLFQLTPPAASAELNHA